MIDYEKTIYKMELEAGPYIFDISIPDIFVEKEVTKLPFHHIHAKYEVVYICGKRDGQPKFFQVNPPQRRHAVWFEDQTEPLYHTSIRFSVKNRQQTDSREVSYSGSVLDAFFSMQDSVQISDTFGGQERLRSVRRELQEKKNGFLEVAKMELAMLLLELARRLPTEQITEQAAPVNTDQLKLDLIDEFFYQNFSRPNCKREDLAEILNISERQLSRIFIHSYGMSFRQRLLQTRMEMAEALRKKERLSAEQLSERVGYSSASAFRAAYKNYFGYSFREK